MAYDSHRNLTVLFGGELANDNGLNDTWVFDGSTWTDVTDAASAPPARGTHSLVFDPVRQQVVVAGGLSSPQSLAIPDMWALDLQDTPQGLRARWTRIADQVEPLRCGWGTMVVDTHRRKYVYFGGTALAAPVPVSSWFQFAHGATWEAPLIAPADFNTDGDVGVQDLFDFLTAWFARCP